MRRRPVLLMIPVVGAFAIAGCGSGSDEAAVDTEATGDLVPVVARAAAETDAASTGRFTMTAAFDAAPWGETTFRAEGAYDEAAGRASVTMDTGAMAEAVAELFGPGVADDAGLLGGWTVVVDGDTAYVDMFGLTGGWVSIPTEADLAGSTPMGPVGAQEMLDVLAGVADVTEVGTEDVGGVETTHYEAIIDLEALVDQGLADAAAQGADPAELAAALEAFEQAGAEVGDIPVEVWVDGDGFVRRITMSVTMSAGAGGDAAYVMTAEFSDFGEPVDIEVPDPSEVTPLDPDDLAGGGVGGLFGD